MTAATQYAEHQKDIAALLKLIKKALRKHAAEAKRDRRSWGYAGDLSHVQGQMTEALAFLLNIEIENVEPLVREARKV